MVPLPDKESPAEAGQGHPGKEIKMKISKIAAVLRL
jgi:hypothetical protein